MQYARVRENKAQQEGEVEEATLDSIEDYFNMAADRRPHIRAGGNKNILTLISQRKIVDRDLLDRVLDVAHGALDSSRDAEERSLLTRLAALIILGGHAEGGFANEFGEAIGKEIPNVVANEETADLAQTMLHALVIAQAVEDNMIMANADTSLADWLVSNLKLPKHSDVPDLETDVTDLLVHQLEQFSEDAGGSAGVLHAVAIALEHYGKGDRLNLALLERTRGISAKAVGGKDARKELDAEVRIVENFLKTDEVPSRTLKLITPRRDGTNFEVELKTFADQALLESIKYIAGSESVYGFLLDSPVIHGFFGVEVDRDESTFTRNHRNRERSREATYDRLVAAKDRAKHRGAARDRKRDGPN